MPDDQVRIDPEFQPHQPGEGQAGRLRLLGVLAVVVAAFTMGWLLRSPTESGPAEEAVTAGTELAADTTAVTTTTRPRTTTTTTVPEVVELEVPLGDAVPGFTDTLIMLQWGERSTDLLRWGAPQAAPETVLAYSHEEDFGWIPGVDASGRWYAVVREGVLAVQRFTGGTSESWFEPPFDAAVGVRVAGALWHDTAGGQLAWLSCPRSPAAGGTLHTLDVTNDEAIPEMIASIDGTCGATSRIWVGDWGDWGFNVGFEDGGTGPPTEVLLGPDGNEMARSNPAQGVFLVAGNPDGTTIWVDHSGASRQPESYVLSRDGAERTQVPGVVDGELIDHALWAPDGSRLAVSLSNPDDGGVTLRVVDGATGAVLTQIEEPGWVWPRGWSTDSRYLLYERWPEDFDGWGPPEDAELVFHDVSTDAAVAVPLPAQVGELWVVEATPPAELVAHYRLDGDATDASGYGHDGTVVGATSTSDRFGTPDGALAFDSEDDRIAIDMAPQLEAETVSIAAWVKLDATTSDGREVVASYGEQGHVLAIQHPLAPLGGLQMTGPDCEFTATDAVLGTDWHHLAMTRDAIEAIRVYFDGESQLIIPGDDLPSSADPTDEGTCRVAPSFHDQMWIGTDPGDWQHFRGAIDDVRIYSGVLTDDEIRQLALEDSPFEGS
jgi:hypothetical protein